MLKRERCERSLLAFVRHFWHILEPSRPFVEGWVITAICEHLEAVTYGEITHLLMNVPPGSMKSMLTDVFWPAWEWGPRNLPATRYLCASYSQALTIRDNQRFLNLVRCNEYIELWGDRFTVTRQGEEKIMNDATGWKLATSVGGVGTGERGDRIIIDDPHNVQKTDSDLDRAAAIHWFTEVLPLRVNDALTSSFIVIMQRVHEEDISGLIIAEELGYVHLMIPMEYDHLRHCTTAIGWTDPRSAEDDLYWPERFPQVFVDRLKYTMGRYGVAAQLQQSPSPKGGGIIKEADWQVWPKRGVIEEWGKKFPVMDFVVVSVDTAMTMKEQNDESAITVWGVWRDWASGAILQELRESGETMTGEPPPVSLPRIMLQYAYSGRLEFHALTERIRKICKDYRCDVLLIEAKNNGFSVAQEIIRLNIDQSWATHLQPVKGDKMSRTFSVAHFFEQGMIYAPKRNWADKVIQQCAMFPKGKHDDLVDSVTQALQYLRQTGLLAMDEERQIDVSRALTFQGKQTSIPANYDV